MMTPVNVSLPFIQQHLPAGSYRLASTTPAAPPSSSVGKAVQAVQPALKPTVVVAKKPKPQKESDLVRTLNKRLDRIERNMALMAMGSLQEPRPAAISQADLEKMIRQIMIREGLLNEIRNRERSLLVPRLDVPGPE